MYKNLIFDHIGVATKNIEQELNIFHSLGYKQKSEIFIDENQGIKGVFIEAQNQPRLELLENLYEKGPLTNFLKKNIKYYHMAYQTKNIEQDVLKFVNDGALIISPIKQAVYYKKVAFLLIKNLMIIELVQL